ncbi:hypothetical protein EFY79_15675 [Hanamia caeni]|uniref:Uncharacterized protein n=1 Tax=Hanamia caeni TaxID=2294116 RepID=A0A3M9NCC0_9BACT|nr:hypothetical protein EFY79_15675 [Hanamia caeni]
MHAANYCLFVEIIHPLLSDYFRITALACFFCYIKKCFIYLPTGRQVALLHFNKFWRWHLPLQFKFAFFIVT